MEKLIITVTCDSTMSYPSNPHNPTPKGWQAVADEYVRSVQAGASICHLHGPYTVDAEIQADGTKLSDLDVPGLDRAGEDERLLSPRRPECPERASRRDGQERDPQQAASLHNDFLLTPRPKRRIR